MKTETADRLSALQEVTKRERLATLIFPSTDPHNNEYVPSHWGGREWISGPDDSADVAVVTMNNAALWADSRCSVAAANQLAGTEFQLMKQGLPETPTIADWLGTELQQNDSTEIGMSGQVNTRQFAIQMKQDMRDRGGITIRTNLDPLAIIWKDRLDIPKDTVQIQPLRYTDERTADKLTRIRQALRRQHTGGTLIFVLGGVTWTLNLRDADVRCNPMLVAYLLTSTTKATLLIDPGKLTPDVRAHLKGEGVEVDGYDQIKDELAGYDEYNIALGPQQINHRLFEGVSGSKIFPLTSPIPLLRAVKNQAEVAGFRAVIARDGVAMVKFLQWLEPAIEAGGQTEMSLDEKLTDFRSEQDLFKGVFFDTIVDYEEHGVIVHCEATSATNTRIEPRRLVLIDSGGQYQDGITDITRTIALSELTNKQRRMYTLVLRGHIQPELCKFPSGARGSQLDALAWQPMWRERMSFLHDAGHGVGSYLNVREGSRQVRMKWRPASLLAGMIVINEPGIYIENKFDVRIESTLLITPYNGTEFGTFLQFESLTLAPIDTTPILMDMLLEEEKAWLNAHHTEVC